MEYVSSDTHATTTHTVLHEKKLHWEYNIAG